MRGSLERIMGTTLITIVGSRKYSSYGKYACEMLIRGLRDYPVTIVSGLSIGIDAIAHYAALENNLRTMDISSAQSPGSWHCPYDHCHRSRRTVRPLITSRLATEYNKTVGAVPGPINSPTSIGANWLLKLGAIPITDPSDILRELGFAERGQLPFPSSIILNYIETLIINALTSPQSKETLLETLFLDPVAAGIAFSTLEIKGVSTRNIWQD